MYLYKSITVSWQVMDDFVYILNENTDELHILEFVAKDIWLEINGSLVVEDIAKLISQRYNEATYDMILADVGIFMDDLISKGIVTTSVKAHEEVSLC